MPHSRHRRKSSLSSKYPPSPPCSCAICVSYCARPGWWTVEQAARAIQGGYAKRMMLEVAPELTFGVLSPAFRGCEGSFALNEFSGNGCTFLVDERCQLYGTSHQPLECRYCHHERPGMGPQCHRDIEKDWDTLSGRALVRQWCETMGLAERLFAQVCVPLA